MAKKDGLKKILIAEDERPMARALQLKLTNSGFEATAVYNGEEAIAALAKGGFAIVLLDLMMPKVDGFGVLESMKKHGDKTPVMVLTNLSQPEDEKRVKDLGARAFFVKSDTPLSGIVAKVKELLGEV